MTVSSDVLERLKALLFRDRMERELDEELRFHLALDAEARARAGSGDPGREALLALGGIERTKEDVRDARGVRALEELIADTRYALRALRRNIGFTLTVIVVLGLGIGAATAVLTVVNRVLLAGLPYPDAGRLIAINQRNASGNVGTLSVVDVMAIRDQQRSFDAFGALVTTGPQAPSWTLTAVTSMVTPALRRAVRPAPISKPSRPPPNSA